jgi:hypothetical protein
MTFIYADPDVYEWTCHTAATPSNWNIHRAGILWYHAQANLLILITRNVYQAVGLSSPTPPFNRKLGAAAKRPRRSLKPTLQGLEPLRHHQKTQTIDFYQMTDLYETILFAPRLLPKYGSSTTTAVVNWPVPSFMRLSIYTVRKTPLSVLNSI